MFLTNAQQTKNANIKNNTYHVTEESKKLSSAVSHRELRKVKFTQICITLF